MAQHIFAIEESKVKYIQSLFIRKIDNEYVVLSSNRGWCDIAQWKDKYQNVAILTLPENTLDRNNRIA